MNCSIIDVAKRAGVSIATVSRCLKGNYPISAETRKKVMDAVEALNYVPNFMARGLKISRAKLIGVLLPNLRNNVVLSIAESILAESARQGYKVIFVCSENQVEIEKEYLNLLRSSLVDGIITATVMKDDTIFRDLRSKNIPVVLFDRFVGDGSIDWVGEDCYSASYRMTSYIIGRGHERIAYVHGVKDISISIERYNGYKAALNDAGLEVLPELQIEGNFLENTTFQNTCSLFNRLDKARMPTAIFSSSSTMTKGVINAVLISGMRMPDDISIASYGDLESTSAWKNITCIKQNAPEIGRLISDLIIRRIEERLNNRRAVKRERIIVPTTMVEGETIKKLF